MDLTLKEVVTIEYLLQGMCAKQIATARRVSLGTVKMQLLGLYEKFDIPSARAGVVPHVLLAVRAHAERGKWGIRCQACGEC